MKSPGLRFRLLGILSSLFILPTSFLLAQSVRPEFADAFSLRQIPAVPGLPAFQGGILFKSDDPDTVLVVGNTGSPQAGLYSCKVTRDATGHINGFTGIARKVATLNEPSGGGAAGSLSYGPNGSIFFSTINDPGKLVVGQLKPGEASPAGFIDFRFLDPEGAEGTPGIIVVPPGAPGAGRAKILFIETGGWRDATMALQNDGTYGIAPVGAVIPIGFTISGIYIPAGQPKFPRNSILLTGDGAVRAFEVNTNGDPRPETERIMIQPLDDVLASARDPRTGDLLITTGGGVNYLLGGFITEAPRAIITQPPAGTVLEAPAALTVVVAQEQPGALVSKIELRSGGVLLQTETIPPATPPVLFLLKDLPAGNYSFTAVTYDPVGNSATSAPVVVVVTNRPPAVTITSPISNATLIGCGVRPVSVSLAKGSVNLSHLQLLVAGVPLLSQPVTGPGGVVIPLPDVPSGTYTLTAVLTDTAGLKATSAPVQIHVAGPATNQLAASLTAEKDLLLCFQGMPDTDYVLERSPDMTGWLNVWTNRTPSGAMSHVYSASKSPDDRNFFRMRRK